MDIISAPEAFEACEILFGPEIEISADFIKYLQPEGLKSAYRKRAFETHPDHSNSFEKDPRQMNELFIKVNLAYHKLQPLVGGSTSKKQEERQMKANRSRKRPVQNQHFSCLYDASSIPKRKLMLGQFLYYSGLISWQALIEAIMWQQKHRPRIGELAMQWNMLSDRDIRKILQWKDLGKKFGERALLLGYLSRFELMALLGKQRKLRYPIGEYFVRHKILRTKELDFMAQEHQIHNRKIPTRRRP